MKEDDINIDRRKKQGEKANIHISIRVTKTLSEWMKDKKYSPSGIFLAAVRELGFKEKD